MNNIILASLFNEIGIGVVALQNERSNCFEIVSSSEVALFINGNSNKYVNNYVLLSIESGKLEKDGLIHTEGELPRLTIRVSGVFVNLESLSNCVEEMYKYFLYD